MKNKYTLGTIEKDACGLFGKFEKEFRNFESAIKTIRNRAESVITGINEGETRVRAMNNVIDEMEELSENDESNDK